MKIRTIHPEVRIIDATQGLVDYIASDESLDSYREIILAKGWRFDRFQKNAPFVDSHDYDCIDSLLGRVESWKIEGRTLVQRVKWAIDVESNAMAKLGFDMTVKGYLKAVSVGFLPEKMSWQGDNNWADAVKEAGLSAEQVAQTRAIYLQQQQIELSACIIGANPNAVARAFDARDISEEQLAAVGFEGDRLESLLTTGRAWEQIDPVLRKWAALGLQRNGNKRASRLSGSSASNPGGAAESRHLEEQEEQQRADFLAQLRRITG